MLPGNEPGKIVCVNETECQAEKEKNELEYQKRIAFGVPAEESEETLGIDVSRPHPSASTRMLASLWTEFMLRLPLLQEQPLAR